ncbi:hypothetical protein [Lewinella cohaerens]|uniref:hypothetical protein n=1 Tax=Lewinella cohaerens TaxID=70995 RepID=UPI0003789A91|nr:hypothetical protein [Lewinella cohaerens]
MTNKQERPGILGRLSSILGLTFFLIILPLGSYIYLSKGYEYQKEAMKDLRKEQRLTDLTGLQLLAGQMPKMEIGESFYLFGLLPTSADREKYASVLKKLHTQFDIPENLELWTLFADGDSVQVAAFQKDYEVPVDTAQLLYWGSNQESFDRLIAEIALVPEEKARLKEGLIVLLDDSLYIRQAYPYTDEQVLQRLVERTAILLPERDKPKPELRREAEM